MLDFMRSGGILMWPLLALGLVAIAAAARQAIAGGEDEAPERLARAVLAASFGWALLGLVMVTRGAGEAAARDSIVSPVAVLILGIGEALCPAVLGLMTYAAATLVSTLSRGLARRSQVIAP